jgi:hypothetical protein
MRMQTGAICASALMFVGCAGDGTGLDENGRPVGEGGAGELAPQFDSIQANVFTPVCTACHSGAAAPLGLRLEEGASFALLGNPDSSYLIQKLEGTAAVGGRMPLGGSPLPAETIAVIRQWIAEGAQPSSLSPDSMASKPSVLSAAWPMENTSLQQAPVVVVSAQSELDTSLLAAGTLTLRRSGGDADFSNGNEAMLAADIRLRSLSPTVFEVRAPEHEWAVDRYELRVSGGAPLALTNLSSLPIDGDADGQAGGDFVLNFQLEERR